jgi:hypothetical protein
MDKRLQEIMHEVDGLLDKLTMTAAQMSDLLKEMQEQESDGTERQGK